MTEEGQLAQGAHAVPIGGDLVLLDLAADDYLLFADCGDVAVLGERLRGPMDTLLELASAELLHSGPARPACVPPPPLPLHSLPEISGRRPRLAEIAAFGAIWADRAWRRPTLAGLAAAHGDRTGRRDDLEMIAARAQTFFQLLPFAPRNHYVEQPEGDERIYARAVLAREGHALTEVRREGQGSRHRPDRGGRRPRRGFRSTS